MNTRISCLIVAFLGTISQLFAQSPDFSRLDLFMDSLEVHDRFMGNVRLSYKGKEVYSRALGYQDMEADKKMSDGLLFRIGSISKIFTSVLTMQAVEKGDLRLDQHLADFYPEIPNSRSITISNLLQHRSGIHNFTNDELYMTYYTQPKAESEMVEIIKNGGSDFTPDSEAAYSNSNFVLLTFILEKVYDMSYGELIAKLIAKPLGLKNTYVGKTGESPKGEVKSYRYSGQWIEEGVTDMSIPVGAGAIVSNTQDLSRFIEGLFSGKLIGATSLAKMTTIKDNFGMGMLVYPYYDKKMYGHSGGIDGFRSMLAFLPEEEITLSILSNGLNYNDNDISLALLNTFYGKSVTLPRIRQILIDEEVLALYVGEYSSEQIPLRITFETESGKLIAKATGQPETVLEPSGQHTFEFPQAGAVFRFDPEKSEFTLEQGGGSFLFKRNTQ